LKSRRPPRVEVKGKVEREWRGNRLRMDRLVSLIILRMPTKARIATGKANSLGCPPPARPLPKNPCLSPPTGDNLEDPPGFDSSPENVRR
jgi:hypothetical protein